MTKVFGKRSEANLRGVHPDLVRVVRKALTMLPEHLDMTVLEGLRTLERQRQLKRAGATRTLNSRHITGHAVDLAPLIGGTIPKDKRGEWDFKRFKELSVYVKKAAAIEKVPIVWGGDWITFKDGPHFELNRKVYR